MSVAGESLKLWSRMVLFPATVLVVSLAPGQVVSAVCRCIGLSLALILSRVLAVMLIRVLWGLRERWRMLV